MYIYIYVELICVCPSISWSDKRKAINIYDQIRCLGVSNQCVVEIWQYITDPWCARNCSAIAFSCDDGGDLPWLPSQSSAFLYRKAFQCQGTMATTSVAITWVPRPPKALGSLQSIVVFQLWRWSCCQLRFIPVPQVRNQLYQWSLVRHKNWTSFWRRNVKQRWGKGLDGKCEDDTPRKPRWVKFDQMLALLLLWERSERVSRNARYSLPGPCPSQPFWARSPECTLGPGGRIQVGPAGFLFGRLRWFSNRS